MSKTGRIVFILELIFMYILIAVLPDYWKHSIKFLMIYMTIQWVFDHYKDEALLFWDGLKNNITSHGVFFFICVMATPRWALRFHEIWAIIELSVLGFIFSTLVDRYVRIFLRKHLKKNAIIFGVGTNAANLASVCKRNRYSLMDIRAFINCNNVDELPGIHQRIFVDKNKVRDYSKVDAIIAKEKIDTVFIAISELSAENMDVITSKVRGKVRVIKYLPQTAGLVTFDTKVQDFDGLLVISTSNESANLGQRAIKRCIDILGGIAGVLILIPLTIFVYFSNKKAGDTDPIFFTQSRIGKDGKAFKCYKYRTMIPNAEKVLEELMKNDPAIREEYLTNKKLVNDPRITKAGEFLRRTSLDEFPQFINVLKGEMSLIGPRPYLFREKEDMGEYYDGVVSSKPGITGMWQTHGRSDTTFQERLELDDYYYRNWSIWLDMTLLVKTIQQVLGGSSSAM